MITEDMLPATNENSFDTAMIIPQGIAELLKQHKGENVLILDLRNPGDWTDFFIIATANSETHLDGLQRHIKTFCKEKGIDILRQSMRQIKDEWRIIDLGTTIIHLMSKTTRDFYDLERLYSMPIN